MPNKRAEGQKGVLTMMKEDFLAEIDAALEAHGYSDRSSFIREAVYEKLRSMGVEVPAVSKAAPSRVGKGGHSKETKFSRRRKQKSP